MSQSEADKLRPIETLPSDGRAELTLVESAQGQFVLKVARAASPNDFVDRVARISQVLHPSLLPIRGQGLMEDGRVYAIVDPIRVAPLAKTDATNPEFVVQWGFELANALKELHRAGESASGFSAADIYPTSPALLDPTLGQLTSKSMPSEDVANLCALLVERAPRHVGLRNAITGVADASTLASRLEAIHVNAGTLSGEPGTTDSDSEDSLLGSEFGPWILERLLGEGAMGQVYVARHRKIGRITAVKVLRPEHTMNQGLVKRFIDEARAVNAIKNEHIVEIVDFGEDRRPDGRALVYCIMELLDGESLAERELRAPLTIERSSRVCIEVAHALHAAHESGIIHRDIKPDNIFLIKRSGNPDYVKVLDFGVAKLQKNLSDSPKSETVAGVVVGTPDYMSPEQALGQRIDRRSDIYALGLVLYELLAGRKAFIANSFGELLVSITTKPAPPLPGVSRTNEAIPASLANVVAKCLVKDPDYRYQTAQELAKDLGAVIAGDIVRHAAPPNAYLDDDEEKPRRSRLMIIAIATAAAVAIAAAAIWGLSGKKSEAPVVETAPPVAQKPPKPTTIALDLSTTPEGALVSREDTGQLLGVTPLRTMLPAGGTVRLRMVLAGYEMAYRTIILDRDSQVTVELAAKAKDPPPPSTDRTAGGSVRRPSRPSSTKETDRGVKPKSATTENSKDEEAKKATTKPKQPDVIDRTVDPFSQ